MCAKQVTLDALGAELRATEKRMRQHVMGALREAAEVLVTDVVHRMGQVKPFPPINTGTLRANWKVMPIADGFRVENPTTYAAHMELGTRPFTPPIAPLRVWAARKLREPLAVAVTLNARGKSPRGKRRPAGAQRVERLAWAARASIARRGIRGRGFWRATVARVAEVVEAALARRLGSS